MKIKGAPLSARERVEFDKNVFEVAFKLASHAGRDSLSRRKQARRTVEYYLTIQRHGSKYLTDHHQTKGNGD